VRRGHSASAMLNLYPSVASRDCAMVSPIKATRPWEGSLVPSTPRSDVWSPPAPPRSRPTASNPSTRPLVTSTRPLPRGLDSGEVADHEEHVHEPEYEPRGPDASKPDQEEDQARLQEQQGVTEQPEAVTSPGVQRPLGIVDPAPQRGAVEMEGREHEQERRHAHHD